MRAATRPFWYIVAGAAVACTGGGGDPPASGAGGSAGGSGGSGEPRDAGAPPEADASAPDPEADAGTGGGNAEPDAGGTPAFLARQLCYLNVDTLTRVSFPTFEVLNSFTAAPVRTLGSVRAVDPVHGEVFVQRADGLDVFSGQASGLDAPLRSIFLPPEVSSALPTPNALPVVALDLENDTLIVLTQDIENFYLSTYPRNSANLTAPIRRLSFAHDGLLWNLQVVMAIDSERERIFLSTRFTETSQLRTFPLMATGPTAPLETLELDVRSLAISPSRDEIHLLVPGSSAATVTLSLDAPLDDPPLRSLETTGALFSDDVNGELWLNGSTYDVEATGAAGPLFTAPILGDLVGMLDAGDEWLTQRGAHVLTYDRIPSSSGTATPLRLLVGGSGASTLALIGVQRARQEVFLGDANGFISAYPIAASGVTPALRRFWRAPSTGSGVRSGAAHDEASGRIFSPLGPGDTSASVYPDTSEGLTAAGQQVAPGLPLIELAGAHEELLGVKYGSSPSSGPVFEARSTAAADLGTLRRSYTITSPRPAPFGRRSLRLIDLTYDPTRDEVIVAVEDCLTGSPEETGGEDLDCHFDLKRFPRTAVPGTPVETIDMRVDISALDFDEQNDLLLVQTVNRTTRFYAHEQLSDNGTFAYDVEEPGDAGIRRRPRSALDWFSGDVSSVRYCD